MNDDTIQDLKQFITATISQETADIKTDIRGIKTDVKGIKTDIKELDEKLSAKIDDLSSSVAEAIENTNEASHTQLNDHDKRILRLEQRAVNWVLSPAPDLSTDLVENYNGQELESTTSIFAELFVKTIPVSK